MPKRGACSVQLAAAVCCALAGSSAAFLVPSLARAPAVPGRLRAGVTQAHAGPGAESVDRRAAVLGAGAAAAWFVAGAPAGAQTEPPPLSRRAQKPGAMVSSADATPTQAAGTAKYEGRGTLASVAPVERSVSHAEP